MIPREIQREHIISALKEIDEKGYPDKYQSTQWDLFYNGKLYPPKWAIHVAGTFAFGKEYSVKLFSGGLETNGFLKKRGFYIFPKKPGFSSHSWMVEDNIIAYKLLDRSAFLHSGTGVPKKVCPFFVENDLAQGEKSNVALVVGDHEYAAHVLMDNQPSPRMQLIWKADFANALKNAFPKHFKLYSKGDKPDSDIVLKFERLSGFEIYRVSFASELSDKIVTDDIAADELENLGLQHEGRVIEYYGKRYERSPKNRKAAIRIHGLSCNVCGFNFEKAYGERGADYIEVHHVKPIHTYEKEQTVDPYTDLITVCSNCHRMMHRKPSNILTVDEMKIILQKKSAAL